MALLPRLLAAVLVLVVGFLLARLLRLVMRRLFDAVERLIPSQRLKGRIRRVRVERRLDELLIHLIYWGLLLFFMILAAEVLGLPLLSVWLRGLALYLPQVVAALVILASGGFLGMLARDVIVRAAVSAGYQGADGLGRLAQGIILLVAFLIAAEQIGLNVGFLTTLAAVAAGSFLFGAALAFGLGARTAVSNILATHYLRQSLSVEQEVEIGGRRGRILAIHATSVLLEGEEGRIVVPSKEFSEKATVILTDRTREAMIGT